MSEEAIDLKEALERIQDDKDLLLELFEIYCEDHATKMGELRTAVSKNDVEQIKRIAHSLKGASGNISAKKLHVAFLGLEQQAKGNDLVRASQTIAEIDRIYDEAKASMAKIKQDFKK